MEGQKIGIILRIPLDSWDVAQKSAKILIFYNRIIDKLKSKVDRGEITEERAIDAMRVGADLVQEVLELIIE